MKSLDLMKEFDEKFDYFFEFTNGKKVVIWGYSPAWGGHLIESIYKRNNKQVDMIIDNNQSACQYSSSYIHTLDPLSTVIIIAFNIKENDIYFLNSAGFFINKNVLIAKDIIFKDLKYNGNFSYVAFLDAKVQGLEFFEYGSDNVQKINADGRPYSWIADYSLINILDNFVIKEEDAIFDFGCGKGVSFTIFFKQGFKKIGGTELDKDVYNSLISNMKILDIDTKNLYNRDATTLSYELDEYNYFYMYDPFRGETFKKVIKNIEESYFRKKRKVFLIYIFPTCAEYISERANFRLSKKIFSNHSLEKETNIYIITDE